MKPVVIIGAGMSGMLAALFIKKRHPDAQIIILEHSGHAGGHYRGLELEGFGYCDPAMRLIYETGIPDIDQVIRNIMPEDEWRVFPDNEKDIAGIYWQGGLQHHSSYIDLRRLPETIYKRCEGEILHCLHQSEISTFCNAEDYLFKRFGPTTTDYLIRILRKFYYVPAAELDISATYQPAMNRVVLYGEDKMQAILQNNAMRSVIAWPDQLTFPIKRNPPQAALYPKHFGINRIIDAMYQQLLNQDVRFLFHRKVKSWKATHDTISFLTLDDGSEITNPFLVVAANGLRAAFNLLCQEPISVPSPPPSWLVFLRVTRLPLMERLYHFYCFDDVFTTFRVTNYYNYCPDAYDGIGYPLCIELWSNEESADHAIARALAELRQMKVLAPDCTIASRAAIRTHNLHALCTLEYVRAMHEMRAGIKALMPKNMIAIGPFVEEGVMLLYEVWRDMYQKIITSW